MKWQKGRQKETDYHKMKLFSFRIWKFGFDAYILKYAPHTILDWHTDPVEKGKHWRFNCTVKGFASFFLKKNGKTYSGYSSVLFRPDIEEHKLVVYKWGCTKLSFGFVKFE